MSSEQKIEVAVQTNRIARTVLDLTVTSSATTAAMMLVDAVDQIGELNKKLREFSVNEKHD